jgi:hypothetical protein
MNWRELASKLSAMSEPEIKKLLREEVRGKRRVVIATRLHQRLCTLRADRERQALLKQLLNG